MQSQLQFITGNQCLGSAGATGSSPQVLAFGRRCLFDWSPNGTRASCYLGGATSQNCATFPGKFVATSSHVTSPSMIMSSGMGASGFLASGRSVCRSDHALHDQYQPAEQTSTSIYIRIFHLAELVSFSFISMTSLTEASARPHGTLFA